MHCEPGAVPTFAPPGRVLAEPTFPIAPNSSYFSYGNANSGMMLNLQSARPKTEFTDDVKLKASMPQLDEEIINKFDRGKQYAKLITCDRMLSSFLRKKSMEHEAMLFNPPKYKLKLRLFVTSQFFPNGILDYAPPCNGNTALVMGQEFDKRLPGWEIRVEGKLLNRSGQVLHCMERKFSSLCKAVVVELDRDMYGPDNHILEWKQSSRKDLVDGFRVDQRLGQFLGLPAFDSDNRVQRLYSKDDVIQALWTYVKQNKLFDGTQPELIRCDQNLSMVFDSPDKRIKVCEMAGRVQRYMYPPDPVVIRQTARVNTEYQTTSHMDGPPSYPALQNLTIDNQTCGGVTVSVRDVEMEFDDIIQNVYQRNSSRRKECKRIIDSMDIDIVKNIETLNDLAEKIKFYGQLVHDPQKVFTGWLESQTDDLKCLRKLGCLPLSSVIPGLDLALCDAYSNSCFCDERRQAWIQEAITRYMQNVMEKRKQETEEAAASYTINE
ncbi:hypothetical protein ACOME3_008880 [Neoechinorhynchus agilis]